MKKLSPPGNNDQGFVLVTALVLLVVLTLLSIFGTRSTVTELSISGNDRIHKNTFYQADGGTELLQQLLFDNAICSITQNGFTQTGTQDGSPYADLNGAIRINDLTFAEQKGVTVSNISDTTRLGAYYPDQSMDDAQPHTNFYSTGQTTTNTGSGLQMISGYEGLGSGAAQGGSNKLYTFTSQHRGNSNSQSTIAVRWRIDNFILSSASSYDCKY